MMMKLHIYKYHGTGNDFILIDNREQKFPKNNYKLVEWLCNRHFGVGANGLILLENDKMHPFAMIYYNSDGRPSTMCGNGGRCVVAFAKKLGIAQNEVVFNAPDGVHTAIINENTISIMMNDVTEVKKIKNGLFLQTGSPHYVELNADIDRIDVIKKGSEIRHNKAFGNNGTNVNFVQPISKKTFKVRTFERGVEDETYSCGTGAIATALAMYKMGKTKEKNIALKTKGGILEVSFDVKKKYMGLKIEKFHNIWLTASTEFVFETDILCKY